MLISRAGTELSLMSLKRQRNTTVRLRVYERASWPLYIAHEDFTRRPPDYLRPAVETMGSDPGAVRVHLFASLKSV